MHFVKQFFIPILFAFLPIIIFGQKVIPDEVIIINYKALNKELRDVLIDISQESDVTIAFEEEVIPGDSLINFTVRKQPVGVILDYLLNRHFIEHKIVGDQIVLYKDPYWNSDEMLTISGYLRDKDTGETLINATVYTQDETLGTVTNEYGFYSLTVPKGPQRLYYSYLGYTSEIAEVPLMKDTIIDVKMDASIKLNEVTITDYRLLPEEKPEAASVDILSLERLTSNLPVGGEPDVLRLALSMPGVTSGSDGFGGMSVRGGSTDQNLILLDGVPVYNAFHLFGLYSIFNASVIKSAKLYKGAFPSRYTGRLSSVMDIRTREGNNQYMTGELSLGLLTGKASIEGPIIKDKASFLLSYRRTTIDPWVNGLSNLLSANPNVERNTGISFSDINAKVNFSLTDHSKLFFSYYQGSDDFKNQVTTQSEVISAQEAFTLADLDELNWDSGTKLGTVRYNSRLSKKSFLNLTAYVSNTQFNTFELDRVELSQQNTFESSSFDVGYYTSRIEDLGLRADVDIIPNTTHHLKVGAGFIKHAFFPQYIFASELDNLVEPEDIITSFRLSEELQEFQIPANEFELYIEDKISLGRNVDINLGFNQLVVSSGNTYWIPQPRVLVRTQFKDLTLKSSVGRMGQYLHSLSNTGLGVPSDIWIPSTEELAPETSWIYSTGASYDFKSLGALGIEGYYKTLNNVTRYGNGLLKISEDSEWEASIPSGTGEAYGVELNYNKETGRNNLNLAYTLSWSNRQFAGINGGDRIRFRYDRRHAINLSYVLKLSENLQFASNWEFGSGTPITIPDNQNYNYIDNENNLTQIRIFSEENNAELPVYHRLDLGFNFFNKYKWGNSRLTLGVYNLYSKINPLFIDEVVDKDLKTRYEQFYLFKIMPTISYTVNFHTKDQN